MLRWETESGDVKTNQTVHHSTHVHPFIPGKVKKKGKGHPCTGTEVLYRPYGPKGE